MGTLFGWKAIGPNCRPDWHFTDLGIQHSQRDKGSHDPDHVLMRTLAVNLRKNGSDLSQYASILRISSLLDEYGVDYATGEDLLGKFLPTLLQTAVGTFSRCAPLPVFTVGRKIWTFPTGARKFFKQITTSERSLISKD